MENRISDDDDNNDDNINSNDNDDNVNDNTQMTRSAGESGQQGSAAHWPQMRPRMQAAGSQCLLGLLFPNPQIRACPCMELSQKTRSPKVNNTVIILKIIILLQ